MTANLVVEMCVALARHVTQCYAPSHLFCVMQLNAFSV